MAHRSEEITFLLIDDDDIDAMTVERSFKKQNIKNSIVRACDGLEAMEMLHGDAVSLPYIILLDIQMPRMNGLEFLDALRNDPIHSGAVVFILTTSKAEQDMNASYKKHIAGYFVKDEAGKNFVDVVSVLDSYWKVVYLPIEAESHTT